MGSVKVEGDGVEGGGLGVLSFSRAVFELEVLVTAPQAEEVPERVRLTEFGYEGRESGSKPGVDEICELLLALVEGCLVGAEQGGLLGELWNVLMEIERD